MMDYGVGDWVVAIRDVGIDETRIKAGTKLAVKEITPPGYMLGPVSFAKEHGVRFFAHHNKTGFGLLYFDDAPYPAKLFRKYDPPAETQKTASLRREPAHG